MKQQQIQVEQNELQLKAAKTSLQNKQETLMNRFMNHQKSKQLFEKERLPLAEELAKTAEKNYKLGAIDFFTYVRTLEESIRIKLEYLNFLDQYNYYCHSI